MKSPSLEIDSAASDYGLMEMLVQHQSDALRALYERYHDVLHSIVMQIIRDEAEANDVLQDVFLQLWSKPETYCAAKGKPFGWLITLARRRAIDSLRRRQAYARATDRFQIFQAASQRLNSKSSHVEYTAAIDDLRAYLEGLLAQLPPAQKLVVERGFFDGMSQRQIAAAMRLPLGTVKTRMELGVKKLAHMILPTRERVA